MTKQRNAVSAPDREIAQGIPATSKNPHTPGMMYHQALKENSFGENCAGKDSANLCDRNRNTTDTTNRTSVFKRTADESPT